MVGVAWIFFIIWVPPHLTFFYLQMPEFLLSDAVGAESNQNNSWVRIKTEAFGEIYCIGTVAVLGFDGAEYYALRFNGLGYEGQCVSGFFQIPNNWLGTNDHKTNIVEINRDTNETTSTSTTTMVLHYGEHHGDGMKEIECQIFLDNNEADTESTGEILERMVNH